MENAIFELRYALDTFYFLVCGALVMWMAAGFSMLEAGLVRAKSTTEILTKNIALFSIACLAYAAVGYQIMYEGGWALQNLFWDGASSTDKLREHVLQESQQNGFSGSAVYANAADFFFQVVFVATAMSIVSGAVAERMKLSAFLWFSLVMTAFIYPMEGSWTWGQKSVLSLFSLADLGFSDFAGSGIVHLAGATAALSGVLLLGPRRGKYIDGKIQPIPGANLPLAALGTLILWLGWFGFNGGSVLKISDITSANQVAMVFVNTNLAAAAGTVAALLLSCILFRKADLTMILNGALAGLVAITADPVNPSALFSVLIGGIAGALVVVAILGFDRLRLDDPVGALSVHGVCGLFGLLVVPFSNPDATFLGQIVGILTIFIWVFVCSAIVWLVLKKCLGLRVSEKEEYEGVDIGECGMEAYPEFVGK